MKITKNQLKKIIKEEVKALMEEEYLDTPEYIEAAKKGEIHAKNGNELPTDVRKHVKDIIYVPSDNGDERKLFSDNEITNAEIGFGHGFNYVIRNREQGNPDSRGNWGLGLKIQGKK